MKKITPVFGAIFFCIACGAEYHSQPFPDAGQQTDTTVSSDLNTGGSTGGNTDGSTGGVDDNGNNGSNSVDTETDMNAGTATGNTGSDDSGTENHTSKDTDRTDNGSNINTDGDAGEDTAAVTNSETSTDTDEGTSEDAGQDTGNSSPDWITTWISAQQHVTKDDQQPPMAFANNTVRQVLRITLGGDQFRFTFSNEYGSSDLGITKVTVAHSAGRHAIDAESLQTLAFDGSESTSIPARGAVTSDTVTIPTAPLSNFTVTIHFGGSVPSEITGHPGSRMNSFFAEGDATEAAEFSSNTYIERWYYMSQVDVIAPPQSSAVAVVGDSITDGLGSQPENNNRWPDVLADRLLANDSTNHIAMLNQGVGGNNLVSDWDSPAAVNRFERDIINLPIGVKWVIIFEGINDINYTNGMTSERMISAYQSMASKAKTAGIKVYGATILPAGLSDDKETLRNEVNQWIRNAVGNEYDGLIDFDQICGNGSSLSSDCRGSGDGLHPVVEGYRIMGESIDLGLFQ